MTQLDLPLGRPADARDAEFLVSESNARAVHQLEHWGSWPVMAALLIGPRRSGRSTLARIFAAKSHGNLIDDAELANEADIFHAWNRAQAERHPLIIVADLPPPEWKIRLPDLRSRIAASPVLRLGAPDDALVPLLLKRHLERRLILAKGDVIGWLAARVERSHVMLERVADALESAVNQRRNRSLSIQTARATLESAGLLAEKSHTRPKETA
jgi:hypothetical protein